MSVGTLLGVIIKNSSFVGIKPDRVLLGETFGTTLGMTVGLE